MSVRYPRPLRPGDRVGVTAPSSGVPKPLLARLGVALQDLRAHGYDVVVGGSAWTAPGTSAPRPPIVRAS